MNETLAVALLMVLGAPSWGQEQESDSVVEAALLSPAPTIDGHLDEDVWDKAALLAGFTQIEPDEGAPATERTEVRIGYDAGKLYVGARCYVVAPETIIAPTRHRDNNLISDDSVLILLDTFFDRKNAFLFGVNAIGAQTDALVRNEGDEINYNWDAIWDVATSRDDQGWTAEIAIPFRSLRFPKAAEQTWGINVQRLIVHKREYIVWKAIQRYSEGNAVMIMSQAGELRGLKNLKQGRRFDVRPYLLARWRQEEPASDETSFDVGVDLKANLTSDLVLDLTYNLDFAEAEADQQQVNLTRFKLFFPEKRDFFLEGANLFYVGERGDLFKTPDRIFFFSRRIGLTEDGQHEIPVLGGAKLSGRVGGTDVGFLNLTTDDFRYTDRGGEEQYLPRTNFTVLRLKRNVLEKSALGLMWLSKDEADGSDNRGGAVDWDFAFGKNFRSGGFLAQTSTPGWDGDDWAGMADVLWDGRRLSLRGVYTEIGENFRPEMGFFPRLGIREWRSKAGYKLEAGRWNTRFVYLFNTFTYTTDREGNLETRLNHLEIDWLFTKRAAFFLKFFDQTEVLHANFEVSRGVIIPPGEYRFQNYFFGIQNSPNRKVFAYARLHGGEYYDGTYRTVFVGTTLRPVTGLRSRVTYEHTEVDLPAGDFDVDLATAVTVYAFSPRISFRSLLQWRKDDNFDANLVLQWLYKPGAAFYVVYDEFRDLSDLVAREARSTDRALIVKMTYFF